MPDYVNVPIETDPDDLAQDAYDYLADHIAGWEPSDANLDTWIIAALGQMAAELQDVASDVPTSIFRYFGANIAGLPPIDETPAVGLTTWTVKDTAGYIIPARTLVSIRSTDGTSVPFEVIDDYPIAAGSTVTAAGAISIQAIEPGADGSGLRGSPDLVVDLVEQLEYVTAITLTGPTTGGADAEDDDDYLARLVSWMQLISPRPVLAADFAEYVKQAIPGVYRAVAIDNYIPPSNFTAERAVTVAMIDTTGEPVSGTIKAQADAELQAKREMNFVVSTIDPSYALVDVTFNAIAYPGYLTTDVLARAIADLQEYLSPANWGIPPFGDVRGWINQPYVYYSEVITVLNQVEGLNTVTSVALGLNGGSQTTNGNVLIPSDARLPSLPRPGTIAGVVS